MEWLFGLGAFLLAIVFAVRLQRKRAREDALLSPEERRKKRMLEDMADRLSPP